VNAVLRSRCVRWAIGLTVLYVAMDLLFTLEMGARGLLSPQGSVHLDAVALGLACIAVRIVGRVALPVLVGFGLGGVALEAVVKARRGAGCGRMVSRGNS
jgi:Co/Zn/Cd efflux system component